MLKTLRVRRIKATTVRVTFLPMLLLGMLVLAESCTCPFLSSYGAASEENATAEALQYSSPSPSAPTAPALVQHNFQYTKALTNAVSFPDAVATGDLILVAITSNETLAADVKDNHGTYQADYVEVGFPLTATSAPLSDHVDLWYARNVPGGRTTITVSFSAPPDSSLYANSVGIYEYTGVDGLTQLYQRIAATGSGTTPDAGQSPTPLPRTGLYFVVGVDGGPDVSGAGNAPVMAGSGFTLEDQQDDPDFERFYTEDRIGTQAPDPSFSIMYPAHWGVICAAFISS